IATVRVSWSSSSEAAENSLQLSTFDWRESPSAGGAVTFHTLADHVAWSPARRSLKGAPADSMSRCHPFEGKRHAQITETGLVFSDILLSDFADDILETSRPAEYL